MKNNFNKFKSSKNPLLKFIPVLIKNWLFLLLTILIGALLGFFYSYKYKPDYIANTTVILNESNTNTFQAPLGINLGSTTTLFNNENLMYLYSSPLIIEQTLLEKFDSGNANTSNLLINKFLEIDSDIQKTKKDIEEKLNIKISQDFNTQELSIYQKRLLKNSVKLIKNKYLVVNEMPRTDGIININLKSKSEVFSLIFINKLVTKVNNYYIDLKTNKDQETIAELEKKVESYQAYINNNLTKLAVVKESVPFQNPNLMPTMVVSQENELQTRINSELLLETKKQLELTKISANKSSPIIKIIDQPSLPLDISTKSILIVTSAFAIVAGVLFVIMLWFITQIRNFLKNQ